MFDWLKTAKTTQPRKGMPSPELDEAEFKDRFLSHFADPCFEPLATELVRVSGAAWDAYINSRKAPRSVPDVQLVSARTGLQAADADHRVGQVLSESQNAAAKARQSAVVIAFTLAAALAAAAAAAWGAAVIGGRHRDENLSPSMRFSWGK